jgi:hypothetical protein
MLIKETSNGEQQRRDLMELGHVGKAEKEV